MGPWAHGLPNPWALGARANGPFGPHGSYGVMGFHRPYRTRGAQRDHGVNGTHPYPLKRQNNKKSNGTSKTKRNEKAERKYVETGNIGIEMKSKRLKLGRVNRNK